MTLSRPIQVLSVDDHPLLREGLAAVIGGAAGMSMVAQAATGAEAVQAYRTHRPDVTLMDVRLPDMSGIDALIVIRAEFPDARVVMLTTFDGGVEIQRALAAGARGYVLKTLPPRELADVVRDVYAGRKRVAVDAAAKLAQHMGDETLTPREIEVLRHVATGTRNREIGSRLAITEETVKAHLKHIMDKLGAADRTEAVTIALRRGIIEL
jgi:DNA-binding NarL/FixJ family response regulator